MTLRRLFWFSLIFLAPWIIRSQAIEESDLNPFRWNNAVYSCKCYEEDRCWPSIETWNKLNTTVHGQLHRVIPDAAVCYNSFEGNPTFNATACAEVTQNFGGQQWQSDRAVAAHWILWTNNTCLPTTNPDGRCSLGYYPRYVILAKTRQHIQAGVDFARKNNIRLVIRNTGHDFLGRSTGYGSLAINTHSFKDVKFIRKHTGPGGYTGGAVTVGAGIQGRELLRLANQEKPKLTLVTGECPTVGFAGGFIQGGGHGPLASFHGMAADQVLSFDVVTADGKFRTVNAAQDRDLFWALKGGGPGTFAVVVSVTVKTFTDIPAAGIVLNINQTHTTDETLFWKGFAAFHNLANHWVENGMFVYYELFPGSLHVQPFVGPNMDKEKITEVLQPLLDQLAKDSVPYSIDVKEYATFFDLYIDLFQDEGAGANALVGGRLFTKQDIAEHGDEIVEAYKTSGGAVGHIVGPGTGAPEVDNAINPVWRNASSFSITNIWLDMNATLADKATAQKRLTEEIDGPLRAASPHGAAYVNEGDLEEPNWQVAYWGSNYPRLKALKAKWDPRGVFYARTTPGTEAWEVIDYGRRLCKKKE
ncbi:FAD binding domain-containing protein [Crepidotus variabilis]|uniref:FAD binding domain-containing protein n=1 Tax=Crepidotus variabilis TaxID=179855 RepID=A0A9P6JHX1_9AGAR|nr:FAD binding domain-containing protein [Crepidotus variabilis]